MKIKRFLIFAGKVILVHVMTYMIVGAFAYPLLTREFYEGASAIFPIYLRSQSEPALWSHVMTWMIPIEVIRGLLIAIALYPFFEALNQKAFLSRFLSLAGLYIILGFWADASPAPGTLEGVLMLKPFVTPYVHLKVQPELLVQGSAMAAWVSWWMASSRRSAPAPAAKKVHNEEKIV